MSLKSCEAKLKELNKTYNDLRKKTDPKSFEAAKQTKTQEIHSLGLQSAEIKWKMETRQNEKNKVINAQNERRDELNQSRKKLDGLALNRRKATENLKNHFGGRRIKNPEKHLTELQDKLQAAQASLKISALSPQEEKKLIRTINDLKAAVADTAKYIDDDVSKLYDTQDTKKKEMTDFVSTHVETEAAFKKAKADADKLFQDLSDLRDAREEINGKIKTLSEEKNNIISVYNANMKKRNDVDREITRCRYAIEEKKLEKSMQTTSGPAPKERNKPKEKKKPEPAPEEEVKPQVSLDERRAAAIAAWEKMQKEKDQQKNMMEKKTEDSPKQEEASPTAELNEDAKLCQTLIALCQNMKPKQSNSPSKSKKSKKKKRKPKKMRLTHAPDTFSNFARLGVNIPVWTQDLDKTISALKERLEQCSGNEENMENEI